MPARRAPSGRHPNASHDHGAGRADARRRPHRGAARLRRRAAHHGRAAPDIRRDDVRPRRPLRSRRGPPAAPPPHARSRPRHRRGPRRVFTLLHLAWPVLLNFDEPGTFGIARWSDRVQLVDAKYDGVWKLPAIGAVAAPGAVLVRPDGYVAWAENSTREGLIDALSTWFGPPAAT